MKIDLHTHSECSFDCDVPFSVMCDAAAEAGISVYACTDHCDLTATSEFDKTISGVSLFVERAREQEERFAGKMKILKGVELGQPMHNEALANRIVSIDSLDFVLCSVHDLRGNEDFYYLRYDDENVPVLLRRYFDEILETVRWGRFDSLAHLTYPLRYICGEYGMKVDLNDYKSQVDEILSLLARNGKALEINTSGLGKKLADTMPPRSIVKRFFELGGEYITVGSDSHVPENIGLGIDKAYEIAKDCGFQYVTYFQNRKPNKVKI